MLVCVSTSVSSSYDASGIGGRALESKSLPVSSLTVGRTSTRRSNPSFAVGSSTPKCSLLEESSLVTDLLPFDRPLRRLLFFDGGVGVSAVDEGAAHWKLKLDCGGEAVDLTAFSASLLGSRSEPLGSFSSRSWDALKGFRSLCRL